MIRSLSRWTGVAACELLIKRVRLYPDMSELTGGNPVNCYVNVKGDEISK